MFDELEYRGGELYWRTAQGKRCTNKPAGFIDRKGYRRIQYAGRKYFAHRIVWWMHGRDIPEGLELDHINRRRDDNRLENLRVVDKATNAWNRDAAQINSSTGYRGVSYVASREPTPYVASIRYNGKRKTLGYRKTAGEAHALYLRAKAEYHT